MPQAGTESPCVLFSPPSFLEGKTGLEEWLSIWIASIAECSRESFYVSLCITLMKNENREEVKEKFLNNNIIPLSRFVGFECPFSQNWLGNSNMCKYSEGQKQIHHNEELLLFWSTDSTNKQIVRSPNRYFISKFSCPFELSKVVIIPQARKKL